MDIPDDLLAGLTCHRCDLYLSRGPIYLQHDGNATCGRCYSPKRPATRNTQYEITARFLRFPCKNRDLGCPETVPYADEKEEIPHEEMCEYRQYVCPVLGSAHCNWLGTRSSILQHCEYLHSDNVMDNPTILFHDISKSSVQAFIIRAFHVLFLLHVKVSLDSAKIYHSIRYLGRSEEASDYSFTVTVKRNDEELSKKGEVAPQGRLVIQEHTSLTLDTNSLLGVLGGYDGTSFTVALKQKIKREPKQEKRSEGLAKGGQRCMEQACIEPLRVEQPHVEQPRVVHPAMPTEVCTGCGSQLTVRVYRDEAGWRGKCCAPTKVACRNWMQGCKHVDIDKKCIKHTDFFCDQRKICWICESRVARGTLSAHYGIECRAMIYNSGFTWRATTGSRYCLVPSATGTALCWYIFNVSKFALFVYVREPSERLREFQCKIRVFQSSTGLSCINTPDPTYNERYDWHIILNKDNFSSWSSMFDVCVNITKVK